MKRSLSEVSLKPAVLIPMAMAMGLLLAAYLYGLFRQEEQYTQQVVNSAFSSARKLYDEALKVETKKLSAALAAIVLDEGLRDAMKSKDRNALLERSAPLFKQLRERYGITHFYFTGPDRINVLRVHQPERFGDRINRHTTTESQQTGRTASGLELGPLGIFTLRVVFPWFEGSQLIGYVELGEEIEHILDQIKAIADVDLYVLIDKQHLSQEDWQAGQAMLGRPGDWNLLTRSVIAFRTGAVISPPIRELLEQSSPHEIETRLIAHDGRTSKASAAALIDASRREVGHMLLTKDISEGLAQRQLHIAYFGGAGLLLGSALFAFLYAILSSVNSRLQSSSTSLKRSEERFRSLVESSSDWIWELDADGRYVYASPKIRDLLGYAPEEILGKTPFDLMPTDEAQRVSHLFSEIVGERKPFADLENRNRHKDGHELVFETSGVPILGSDGILLGYRGIDRDVTERKRVEQALDKTRQRLSLNFQQTPLAAIEWDVDFRVVDWNQAAELIFGYSKAEALGRHAMDLILPDSAKAKVAEIWNELLTGQGGSRSANENLTKDGRTIFCEWYNTPLVDKDGQVLGVSSRAQDVTDKKEAEQRLHYLAYFDALTGLPNRALFIEHLSRATANAGRNQRPIGLMFFDLDHFKDVNDTLGHAAGDQLLKGVAQRTKNCFRESDTVARLGGDEFAIVLTNLSQIDDAVQIAQKLLEAFKRPFEISGSEVFVSVSIGITLYPFDDIEIHDLLRNADVAMYQAKKMGRDNYQFYSAEMRAKTEKRVTLEKDLRYALERDEFRLHYQPQLELATGRVIGVEALIRWQHPQRGMVSPADFIPVAEESGLIVPIGEWVLRTACAQARDWRIQGLGDLIMAVNLSARQFRQGGLVQLVTTVLEETGLDPRQLELEITESLLIDGADAAVLTMLESLKRLGVQLAIDDFGTGYSSLSYLKRFPIDKLKIDQSFVRDVISDSSDASLVKAIIAIARSLRLKVIAEGVETEAQLKFLADHACDQMQGFLFSRALPGEECAALIASGRSLFP